MKYTIEDTLNYINSLSSEQQELLKDEGKRISTEENTKRRVYLVFTDTAFADHQFRDVFFTEEAAKQYVARISASFNPIIETHEETDNGRSKEIY